MAAVHSPALLEELAEVARQAAAAGHGGKSRVYEAAAQRMGCSLATLLQRLKLVRVGPPRKRRADAGGHTLSREEAALIAATVEETRRLTGTGALALEHAVEILRSNGKITAGRIDTDTGEFTPLSVSAIRRALRHYNMHPEQLAEPTPAARLQSPHPNWCWQIDASVSRQFYLADDGTRVMPEREFYRGKPGNLVAINEYRLWRYVVTDHASGALEVLYVRGAESSANVLATLIHAMTRRADGTMHGVPRHLMADPGSAMKSQVTANLCAALGINLIINEVGNARAKGQVENAQYLWERNFEAALKLRAPVTSLEEINRLAAEFARNYNATAIHSRTGTTRRDAWLRITREQLIEAPSVETLRALATTVPVPRRVRDYRVKHGGRVWDLTGLPGVLNGAQVEVVINALDPTTLRVVVTGADGRPGHYLAPEIRTGEFGFELGAATIGANFRTPPETPADAARKEIERLAMDVTSDAEAAAARKAKRLAFGGTVDPLKPSRDLEVVPALPRASTPSTVAAPAEVEPAPRLPQINPVWQAQVLTHEDMARGLKRRVEALGGTWCAADMYAQMVQRWPDGVTEDQLDACATALLRSGLRVVGGAA